MLLLLCFAALAVNTLQSNPYQECAKLFNPNNYIDRLPSLSLPFISNIAIPPVNVPDIKPSKVKTTKVISLVTKYVYRNPVCVKYTSKKSCKPMEAKENTKNNMDYLVTKEYFVNDLKSKYLNQNIQRQHKTLQDYQQLRENNFNDIDMYVASSEESKTFGKAHSTTPKLTQEEINDMLIEDRLDQLETILPQYTRKRVYQTSTITVTKVKSNQRATATLLVKNCMPQGYEVCPSKNKRRKSKVAEYSDNSEEKHFFG
ncbi:unnamed protein product [Brassicogethes aeneus]|uniref:Uncharacterized protein n=1 Tax=Brassicogethes aeneus TaxID=1431903 RepID=A0A9P0AU02_BRAAE|nr:unnamed protein product [Brassicogethes aeneus]